MQVIEHTETRLSLKETSPLTPGCAVGLSALVLACPSYVLYLLMVDIFHRKYLYFARLENRVGAVVLMISVLIWVLLGVNLVVVPLTTTYTFDKMLGTVVIEQRSVIKTYTTQFLISDIADFQGEEQLFSENDANRRMIFVLNSGKRFQLRDYIPSAEDSLEWNQQINDIRNFLNLPSQK